MGPAGAQALSQAPAVRTVVPLQHRFAYVGPDLQDLYGVDPTRIASATPLRDSFVPGSTIHAALAALATTPDGVLLAAETLHDYQLRPGDLIRLRLQVAPSRAYRTVPFHVIGMVKEFPTAPKDSFIVANAAYITSATHDASVGTFLISSNDPTRTAAALRQRLRGTGPVVTDVVSARAKVTSASGLAATDLNGLARLELGFGAVLALACSGLALLLGIFERRRPLVLLTVLGATAPQRRRFVVGEMRAVLAAGLAGGAAIGACIAYMLVKVLTGIFDPAPDAPSLPTMYLIGLVGSVVVVTAVVVEVASRLVGRARPSALRDL